MKNAIIKLSQIRTVYVLAFELISALCLFALLHLILPWYEARFGEVTGPDMSEFSMPTKIIALTVFAPLFETLICQWLPIYLLLRIKNIPYWIPVVVSSLWFGLQHCYNVLYVLYAGISGGILATSFLIFKEQKNYSMALGLTILLHSVFNGVLFLIFNFMIL
jgi:hypothetical protein